MFNQIKALTSQYKFDWYVLASWRMWCFDMYLALYAALPACFTISKYAGGTSQLLVILDGELRALGYESMNRDEIGREQYRKKGAKRFFGEEDDFHVTQQNGQVLVKGPLFASDKLRHLLVKSTYP